MNAHSHITYRLPGGYSHQEVSSAPPVGTVCWPDLGLYLFTDLKKEKNEHIFTLTRMGPNGAQGGVVIATDEYHQFLAAFKRHQAGVKS